MYIYYISFWVKLSKYTKHRYYFKLFFSDLKFNGNNFVINGKTGQERKIFWNLEGYFIKDFTTHLDIREKLLFQKAFNYSIQIPISNQNYTYKPMTYSCIFLINSFDHFSKPKFVSLHFVSPNLFYLQLKISSV